VWKRLRQSLVLKGKLVDRGDGFLSNRRVEQELTWLEDTRQVKRKSGSIGGQLSAKRRANAMKSNDVAQASAQASAQAKSNQSIEEEEDTSLRSVSSPDSSLRSESGVVVAEAKAKVVELRAPLPVAEAVEAFNRTAEANGWRRCRELSTKRKTAISARLRKHGIEGWTEHLAIAAKTEWVNNHERRSKDHQSWRANIDWFSREDTFIRLVEDAVTPAVKPVDWAWRLSTWADGKPWPSNAWGPPPDDPACEAPKDLLAIMNRGAVGTLL
jgi:hypothetical protein